MKSYSLLLLLVCLLLSGRVAAREEARLLTTFSFSRYLGGIVLLQGKLDGYSDTLNFILDTGSGGISLDSTTCATLGVENRSTDTVLSGIGGKRKVHFAFNRSLTLGGLVIDSLDFHINNYALLSHADGKKIDGVIGYSFLKRFIVAIDYEATLIRIYAPGAITYPEGGYTFKPKMKTVPFQRAVAKDRNTFEGSFYFDLGAKMELILNRQFVAANDVFLKRRKQRFIGVEGVGGKEQMQVAVVKKLTVGPFEFKNVPTYIYQDAYNVTGYPQHIGLIGSGIYRRFNLILNFPAGEIFMKPNKAFAAPFDYAYSGLSIYESGQRVLIYDVSPGSPAEQAGLRNGDEIVSIDNISYSGVQAYREALARENRYMVLGVKREGVYVFHLMKTQSIL